MAAIIGLDDQKVISVCADVVAEMGESHTGAQEVLEAVNFNAPGQVVIAGTAGAIDRAADAMKAAGAKRALPIPVSIPAHCALMSPASAQLAERLEGIDVSVPPIPVLHNCNVQVADTAEQIKANLVMQLDSPVRWVETVEFMHLQGVEKYIESGPGKVLGGMVKRIVKGADIACVEKPSAFSDLI